MTTTTPVLEYVSTPMSDMKIRQVRTGTGVSNCEVRTNSGKWAKTSPRFWTSFFARFGISDSIFKYYDHQEVFDRIVEEDGSDTVLRLCTEKTDDGITALSISNPGKPLVHPDQFMDLVKRYDGIDIHYANGVMSSSHVPNSGANMSRIGNDVFQNRFVLESPVDGYGRPSIYLALWREVCSNGAVAVSPAFRSDLTIGKDPTYGMTRALESFDSDDGYGVLRGRFDAAQISPASLNETLCLYKKIARLNDAKTLVKEYEGVVGDTHHMYGVANLESFSERKLRLLPAKCRVYDLLNFASEVATHRVETKEATSLQAWIGSTVSTEYDLEGTDKNRPSFRHTFTSDRIAA